ncbi:hypothetical protein JYU34_007507 [Plutella xylostella]|uniref:Defensin n=1 Tax=Plutella xylostella TaxID=51655 RepID=A0ABQ7QQM3_PLUXY|nr:hypothetical protein JYU34_007507 [Plutella xylostella]
MASMKLLFILLLQLVVVLTFPAENEQPADQLDTSTPPKSAAMLVSMRAEALAAPDTPNASEAALDIPAVAPDAYATARGASADAPNTYAAAPATPTAARRGVCTKDLCHKVCVYLGYRTGSCKTPEYCLCRGY